MNAINRHDHTEMASLSRRFKTPLCVLALVAASVAVTISSVHYAQYLYGRLAIDAGSAEESPTIRAVVPFGAEEPTADEMEKKAERRLDTAYRPPQDSSSFAARRSAREEKKEAGGTKTRVPSSKSNLAAQPGQVGVLTAGNHKHNGRLEKGDRTYPKSHRWFAGCYWDQWNIAVKPRHRYDFLATAKHQHLCAFVLDPQGRPITDSFRSEGRLLASPPANSDELYDWRRYALIDADSKPRDYVNRFGVISKKAATLRVYITARQPQSTTSYQLSVIETRLTEPEKPKLAENSGANPKEPRTSGKSKARWRWTTKIKQCSVCSGTGINTMTIGKDFKLKCHACNGRRYRNERVRVRW